MTRYWRPVGLFLSILALVASTMLATADVSHGEIAETGSMPDAEMLETLTGWIVAHSDLPARSDLPQVQLTTKSEMSALRAGPDHVAGAMGATEALYDREHGIIHLPPDWQATPIGQSALLHELVHHMQARAGRRYSCAEMAEGAAYELQEAWLAEHGETLKTAFQLDRLSLFFLTNCPL